MKRIGLMGVMVVIGCGGTSPGTDEGESSGAASSEDSEATGMGTTAAETPADTGTAAETSAGSDDTTTGTPGEGESPGCGGDPSAIPVTLEIDGTEREFIVSLPEGYDPDHPYALIFAWHALGTNGAIARAYYRVEEASDGEAIVVYPEGLIAFAGQTGWNLEANGYDIAFFDALYEQLTDNLCVDLDRVFSTGHSFGGFMSNSVGCYRGDVIRAIAPVAGGGPEGACQGSVAAWIAHGTVDATVPYSAGEGSRNHWLQSNACGEGTTPTEPSPCVAYESCAEGHPVIWCSHDEAVSNGHGWPSWAGSAIWSFFDSLE